MNRLYNDDCFKVLDELIEEKPKIDLVLTDLPYGITGCKWDDSNFDLNLLWEKLKQIIRDDTNVVLFCDDDFFVRLVNSNPKDYKYMWVWVKNKVIGHLNAHKEPMRQCEFISVFFNKRGVYNPQHLLEINKPVMKNVNYLGYKRLDKRPMVQRYTNYPRNVVYYDKDKRYYHPTQKPVKLLEYLIKTYSNEGDTVLDVTMGSGSTGVACVNTGRNFIGCELNEQYFEIAKKRIENPENEA